VSGTKRTAEGLMAMIVRGCGLTSFRMPFGILVGFIFLAGSIAIAQPLDVRAVNEAQWEAPPAKSRALTIRAQILLARSNISPGEIDGNPGENLDKAIAAFAARQGVATNKLRLQGRSKQKAIYNQTGPQQSCGLGLDRPIGRRLWDSRHSRAIENQQSRIEWLRPIDELGRLAARGRRVERNSSRVYRRAKVPGSLETWSAARRPLSAKSADSSALDVFLNPDAVHWLLDRNRIRRRESILQRLVERHVTASLLAVAATAFGLMMFVFRLGSHPACHPSIVPRKTLAKRRLRSGLTEQRR
jgi:peptidoglycan hydrolase-like protein with peptidoglycan-binding domain